jgi:hypothetical protein
MDWLRAELEALGRLLDQEIAEPGSTARITRVLQSWFVDPDLAGVREPQALFKLPQAERQPWRQLWGDVSDTLGRAQRKRTPKTKSNAK